MAMMCISGAGLEAHQQENGHGETDSVLFLYGAAALGLLAHGSSAAQSCIYLGSWEVSKPRVILSSSQPLSGALGSPHLCPLSMEYNKVLK